MRFHQCCSPPWRPWCTQPCPCDWHPAWWCPSDASSSAHWSVVNKSPVKSNVQLSWVSLMTSEVFASLTSIQGFLSWVADVQALTMPWLLRRANSGPQRWRPRMPKCTEEAEIWDSTIAPPSIPSREMQPGAQPLKYDQGCKKKI